MTVHSVSATEFGVWEQTLVANEEDVITFARECEDVRVTNVNGVASLYFTVDNSVAAVGGKSCYWLPAVAGATREVSVLRVGGRSTRHADGTTPVRVIAAGASKYSVEGTL